MAYSEFRDNLQTFNNYISAEKHSVGLEGTYGDSTVVRAEIGGNMKTMICNLLAGNGLKPMPQIQICLDMNLNELLGLASANAALMGALASCRPALQAFNTHTGLSATLMRLNAVIGEAAAIASMINFCATPINPKPIPNLLETVMGAFLGKGEAILNKLGRVIPDRASVCFDFSTGKLNTDAYINGGLLQEIRDALEAGIDISGLVDDWIAQLMAIADDFKRIIQFENDIANAAMEQNGLGGGTGDSLAPVTLPDANPEVEIFQSGYASTQFAADGTEVAPIIVTKINNATSTTSTKVTLDVVVKFTEKIDPASLTCRLPDSTAPSSGYYGTIRILGGPDINGSNERIWNSTGVQAINPKPEGDGDTIFGGTVVLDTATYQSSTFTFAVGSTNHDTSPLKPTSISGKEMLSIQAIQFTCKEAVAGEGATNYVGTSLPDQTPEQQQKAIANYQDMPTAINNAQNILTIWNQLAGYPVQRTDGTILTNIFDAFLDEDSIALASAGESYIAPVYTQVAEKDYCGNVIGYKYEFTQGSLETPDAIAAGTVTTLASERPRILEITPSSGDTTVVIDGTVQVRFNQDMDFSTFTLGDTQTTWSATKVYSIGDLVEYNGAEYSSAVANNTNQVPPTSSSYWTATGNVAVLTAGSGSVKFKNSTTNTFETGGTITYSNKLLTYTPAENMIASNVYQLTIVGQNTSAMYPTIGSSDDHVSPVENTSGIAMASTFQSTFTINSAGNSTASLTVSSAAGTIKTPSYTVAELNALAAFYSANDQGSQAWCSNETGGACMVVYNGANWVRIDNSNVISA